jgi:hypothetical protein
VFWSVLLYVAARRAGWMRDISAGLFGALYTLSVGVQTAFFALYEIYFSHDPAIYARSFPRLMWAYLPLRFGVALRLLFTFAIAVALVGLARRLVRPRKWPRRVVPLLVPVVLVGMTRVPANVDLRERRCGKVVRTTRRSQA